ncbi:cupin-like domain-containing protein [Hyalangium sp.]|uniref:cupin-like domain-containing protein n=1 Tax=Hyalangium sp. TaxID=2028555 RepID=UPI002D62B3CD|nr:cupin-like domain-containing protein [Hyalangium sp.]HYH99656.1 cupin-like domain-containing protein [Hyalangium sp.]
MSPREFQRRRWIAENLARGVSAEQLLALLLQFDVDPFQARAELEAAAAHPAVRAARPLAPRRQEIEALLDVYSSLHQQSPEAGRIDRRVRLSPAEFFEQYYFRHRPVVMEGLLSDWPASNHWSPESFAERFGDVEVELMAGRETITDPDFHGDLLVRTLRMREFVARLRAARQTNDFYLVARNHLLQNPALSALRDEIRAPAGFVIPDLREPDSTHLWFGPAGTLSNLHHDEINVLFCQVYGRKRFWLIPSFEIQRLYNDRGFYSAVDILSSQPERYPDFQRANVASVIVGPGDALLIPVGWWHAVRSLEVSISVTFVRFALPQRNHWLKPFWIGPPPSQDISRRKAAPHELAPPGG